MKRRAATVLLVLIVASLGYLELRPHAGGLWREAHPPALLRASPPLAHPPRRGNPNPPYDGPPNTDAPSELTRDLNSPQTDIHADLRLLNDLFAAYRVATKGPNPIGENADITEVLMGRNRLGFAFIPRDCPAVNAAGELCDRWGTPYFFHALSGEEMEIRSAGPDKKLYTDDDEVLTP